MENKKEIDRLAADFKKRSWEYEDEEPVREMSYDQFCGERYRRLPVLSREEYLTEDQKREKEHLHAEISGNERGFSSYGRYLEHRDVDERYDGMAFENYKKAEERTLRPEYAELERENAARMERNRTLDERNARTEGKEAAAVRMLELMGYGHDDALREVKSASKIGKRQEAMERREQRRKEAEAEYEKKAGVIDGKREKWLADYMKKGKVREVTRVPLGEAPENFVETKREMNGRYGWFESSARYNLPEYVSGYAFDSKRLADSYRKFDERKKDAYRELVSGADLDFDPVETARRNSEMRRSEREGADARLSVREEALRDALVDKMRNAGMDVSTDWKEGQKVLDDINGRVTLSKEQKKILDTATMASEIAQANKATAVSSTSGAKVLKKLESLKEKLGKLSSNRSKTILGDISEALKSEDTAPDRREGSSYYKTFVTENGKLVTIRISNHNATVSNFDANNEKDGISIVISNHPDKGINNDGDAHIEEFFYSKAALSRAYGKPLADMVGALSDAVRYGRFKDPTGIAIPHEVNAEKVREHRAYHGSAADFDVFDHSHMGEEAVLQKRAFHGSMD